MSQYLRRTTTTKFKPGWGGQQCPCCRVILKSRWKRTLSRIVRRKARVEIIQQAKQDFVL